MEGLRSSTATKSTQASPRHMAARWWARHISEPVGNAYAIRAALGEGHMAMRTAGVAQLAEQLSRPSPIGGRQRPFAT